VLVTAADMHGAAARLQRFTRPSPDERWRPDGGPVSARIGRNGMAWGYPYRALARPGEPVKVEGDKRAPAGIYRIGDSFGFAPSSRPNYRRIGEGMVCVDDPAHRAYNTITTRAQVGAKVHGENMWRVPEYRRGLLVDYPSSRQARGGSCIFIHLRLPGKTGTGGCVALPEPELAGLQDFAQGGAVLAIVPEQALDRFGGCLPARPR
jgi:D-alanyl-D-alanine dipeptidase